MRFAAVWAFLHLLGAFAASLCAEMVKQNAQIFCACGGLGGLRRFLIGNGKYLLHATFAAWAVWLTSCSSCALQFSPYDSHDTPDIETPQCDRCDSLPTTMVYIGPD